MLKLKSYQYIKAQKLIKTVPFLLILKQNENIQITSIKKNQKSIKLNLKIYKYITKTIQYLIKQSVLLNYCLFLSNYLSILYFKSYPILFSQFINNNKYEYLFLKINNKIYSYNQLKYLHNIKYLKNIKLFMFYFYYYIQYKLIIQFVKI